MDILEPFRDIVNKGNAAVANAQAAGGSQQMLASAQSLVKEGQRALNKLEPLCTKGLREGDRAFESAVEKDEEIDNFRSALTDFLWDFDEYINTDDFDADKFTELQVMSRKAAPKIVDKVRKIVLARADFPTSPAMHNNSSGQSSIKAEPLGTSPSPFSSPVLNHSQGQFPGTSLPHSGTYDRSVHGSTASSNPSVSELGLMPDVNGRMTRLSLPSDEETFRVSVSTAASSVPPTRKDEPVIKQEELGLRSSRESVVERAEPGRHEVRTASLPLVDPWDNQGHPVSEFRHGDRPPSDLGRRSLAPSVESRSPRLCVSAPPEDQAEVEPLFINHRGSNNTPGGESDTSKLSAQGGLPSRSRPAQRTRSETLSTSLASATDNPSRKPMHRATVPLVQPDSCGEYFSPDTVGASFPDGRVGVVKWLDDTDNSEKPTIVSPPPAMPHTMAGVADPGLQTVPIENGESAPIPVDADQMPTYHVDQDCSIGPKSSFHQTKGFCKGAKEVLNGGKGVVQTKRPGFRVGAMYTHCVGCHLELEADKIEYDKSRSPKGTFARHNVAYRLRFLQKSHLTIKRVDHTLYACVFCLQVGHTTNESDATVFFSSRQLLDHLARHPQPLPRVPGFTVIEGEEVPPSLANNFDLHLLAPPEPNPASEHMMEISQRPSAVAIREVWKQPGEKNEVRRPSGEKKPPSRASTGRVVSAHELAQGAKLTGVTWPPKAEGKVIEAWHEGEYASVPASEVNLVPPPPTDLDLSRNPSPVRAVAQWEFAPAQKEKGAQWLKFEEGEEITNIRWKYVEHWCWIGTNVKGKRGMFPQAFIDKSTVDRGNDEDARRRRLSMLERYEAQHRRASIRAATMPDLSGRPASYTIGVGGAFDGGGNGDE